jgi:hypothetical protein
MSAYADPQPFARCPCGCCVIAERPCEQNADLLLGRMWCGRCGGSPRRIVRYVKPSGASAER